MTSLHNTRIPCRGLAAIALVAVLATLALAAGPAGAASLPGVDLGSDSAGARRAPVATSGNFLLRRGVFTPLEDVPGAGRTSHLAINNRGQTVGTYGGGAGSSVRGFLRDKRGRFTRIDVPGASSTLPTGVNDRGRVVGFYEDSARPTGVGGFVREPDRAIARIDFPGALLTQPHGINNRGQIVGFYVDAGGTLHGFLRSKGSFKTIDVPGTAGSGALDINDRGEITGGYGDAQGRTHGYRLRKGVFTTIDPPGAVDVPGSPGFAATAPFGINNRGQVVGQFADARGLHAYLLDDGVYTTIDPPAGPGTVAADINDRGQIVIPRPRSLFIQFESPAGEQ
jgi:probable HAF family extracellular repeat protein